MLPSLSSNVQPPSSEGHFPNHTLPSLLLLLRLPGYAEAFVSNELGACVLLRLLLGVADDGHGGMSLQVVWVFFFFFFNVKITAEMSSTRWYFRLA